MATNPSTLPENSGRITAPDSNYPFGSAKDDSTGTTGDGTPIKKALLNDTYGFYQWLLTEADVTPSGNAETVVTSQLGQSLEALFVQVNNLAAQSDAETGTNNTKWMTPLRTHQAFNEFGLGKAGTAPIPGADVLNIVRTGMYLVSGPGLIANLPVDSNGTILAMARNSGDIELLYIQSVDNPAVYVGRKFTSTISWRRVMTEDTAIGYSQAWQDVTGSRSQGVTYTNSTGKPMQVIVSSENNAFANVYMRLLVDGVIVETVHASLDTDGITRNSVSAIVPPGSTYQFNQSSGTPNIQLWQELR